MIESKIHWCHDMYNKTPRLYFCRWIWEFTTSNWPNYKIAWTGLEITKRKWHWKCLMEVGRICPCYLNRKYNRLQRVFVIKVNHFYADTFRQSFNTLNRPQGVSLNIFNESLIHFLKDAWGCLLYFLSVVNYNVFSKIHQLLSLIVSYCV